MTITLLAGMCLFAFLMEARAGEGDRDLIFGFAESLFAEGDYYRAITEYKRFKYLFPVDSLVEKSDFRIGEAFCKVRRWSDAAEHFKSFLQKHPASPLHTDALYLKAQAERELKHYDDALSTLDELIRTNSPVFHDKAVFSRALILVEAQQWTKAREAFSSLSKESDLHTQADRFSQGLARMDELPRKSPALAGTLAALLPGAGHLYTERPRDALVAFLLNGSFIWAAIELFRNNSNIAGGIAAFLEAGWYGGNIYSAVNSTHKYNINIRDQFLQDLKERNGLSLYRDPSGVNIIMYSFNF